ncbi:MAG: hypothetical protein JW754_04720 [Candidatus Aenigmarchaeota archaeon]|nr:hypothetical protein [Candidatus Aenigmarchaeota archaeon]
MARNTSSVYEKAMRNYAGCFEGRIRRASNYFTNIVFDNQFDSSLYSDPAVDIANAKRILLDALSRYTEYTSGLIREKTKIMKKKSDKSISFRNFFLNMKIGDIENEEECASELFSRLFSKAAETASSFKVKIDHLYDQHLITKKSYMSTSNLLESLESFIGTHSPRSDGPVDVLIHEMDSDQMDKEIQKVMPKKWGLGDNK